MTKTSSLVLAGLLAVTIGGSALAADQNKSMMDMKAIHQQMSQEIQAIVNEPTQAKRQVLMDEHLQRVTSQMETCQQMMGGHGNMPQMDHSNMGSMPNMDHSKMGQMPNMDHSKMSETPKKP